MRPWRGSRTCSARGGTVAPGVSSWCRGTRCHAWSHSYSGARFLAHLLIPPQCLSCGRRTCLWSRPGITRCDPRRLPGGTSERHRARAPSVRVVATSFSCSRLQSSPVTRADDRLAAMRQYRASRGARPPSRRNSLRASHPENLSEAAQLSAVEVETQTSLALSIPGGGGSENCRGRSRLNK